MSSDAEQVSGSQASAYALRMSLKKEQAEQAQIRLHNQLGIALFDQGWDAQSAQNLLENISACIGASHGMIAVQQTSTLNIVAAKGQTFPIGARVPLIGALAQILKAPVQFMLHQQSNAKLWSYGDHTTYHEYVLPIAFKQSPVGILALACKNPITHTPNVQMLQSLCGMLGLALSLAQGKTSTPVNDTMLTTLTPREREIFALLPSGASNAELAEKLGIASGTVKIHVERILNKLQLRDRTQAAVKAVEFGYR